MHPGVQLLTPSASSAHVMSESQHELDYNVSAFRQNFGSTTPSSSNARHSLKSRVSST